MTRIQKINNKTEQLHLERGMIENGASKKEIRAKIKSLKADQMDQCLLENYETQSKRLDEKMAVLKETIASKKDAAGQEKQNNVPDVEPVPQES